MRLLPALYIQNRRLCQAVFCLCALMALAFREDTARGSRLRRDDTQALKSPAFALAYPANMPTPFTLPYTLWNGLPMTHALVAGQFRGFILDTALNVCTLKPEISKIAGLPAASRKADVQVFDQTLAVDLAQLPKLTFNLFAINSVPVGLVDVTGLLSPIHARQSDAPVGWLGAPFFGTFQTTFYFDRQAAVLDRPDAKLPTGKGVVTIPMDLSADGRVRVTLTLPGAKPFLAILATSAPITVIPAAVAAEAKLKPLDVTPAVQPNGEKAAVARVVLAHLSVGKATVDDANAVYVTSGSVPAFGPKSAVLGMDFLRHYHVTLNYARRVVVFAAPPKPAIVPTKKPERTGKEGATKHP